MSQDVVTRFISRLQLRLKPGSLMTFAFRPKRRTSPLLSSSNPWIFRMWTFHGWRTPVAFLTKLRHTAMWGYSRPRLEHGSKQSERSAADPTEPLDRAQGRRA